MKEKKSYRLVNSIITKAFIVIVLSLILFMMILILLVNVSDWYLKIAFSIATLVPISIIIVCMFCFFKKYIPPLMKFLYEYIYDNSKDEQTEILKRMNGQLTDIKSDIKSLKSKKGIFF